MVETNFVCIKVETCWTELANNFFVRVGDDDVRTVEHFEKSPLVKAENLKNR